ncbi:hypothetical protein LWI28_029158 [Acer negundo]|uniref:Transmembrane protein n=1 Tax=Acer negundo TaxID=4023 RepID=A0AAD5NMH3_ACENE|nr:hypothetical protein LWI28_029158 [Acer negundo]
MSNSNHLCNLALHGFSYSTKRSLSIDLSSDFRLQSIHSLINRDLTKEQKWKKIIFVLLNGMLLILCFGFSNQNFVDQKKGSWTW